MIGQSLQQIGDVGLGNEIVGLCYFDNRHGGSIIFGAAVGAGECSIASSDGQGPDCTLSRGIVDGYRRVVGGHAAGCREIASGPEMADPIALLDSREILLNAP